MKTPLQEQYSAFLADQTAEAVRLLGAYTAGRFEVWELAGPAKASCRAHVMSALMGRKIPQAKSGVNAILEAFFARLEIDGSCRAVQEDNFVTVCKTFAK